ncbi:MAG: methionyl-tRNA formyltransferase [Thermoguttaceae bacterium]
MRLILMGTGPFAAPTFRELYRTHHDIVALVTSPLHLRPGHEPPPISIVRDIAHQQTTPIFDPEDINNQESQLQLSKYNADLMVVCDYGRILASSTLAASQLGGINLHASLLPKYRGAAPINWAIYNGETKTGVTVIHMTPKVDAGPCIAQAETDIGPEETAVELEKRLSELGAWLVLRTIDAIKAGNLEALAQDPALASKAPRLKKSDGLIDWTRPAAAIKNQIRALEPWPKTYTFWRRQKGPPIRLIFGSVAVEDHAGGSIPGTVLEAAEGRLVIAAGTGAVAPKSIQPVGKRLMSIEDFLRGHRVQPGDRFAAE